MWTARSEELADARGLRFALDLGSRAATFADVLRGWQSDADFRSLFNALLADAPYSAFRWETPPVTTATVTRRFEFVLLDSPGLARRPDPEAFAGYFRGAAEWGVVEFLNQGGDALLVVPCPLAEPSAYGHLAAFVRGAPEPQRHALWQSVGRAMAGRIGPRPVWLSTAGAGCRGCTCGSMTGPSIMVSGRTDTAPNPTRQTGAAGSVSGTHGFSSGPGC
jgi:hypothetical protein